MKMWCLSCGRVYEWTEGQEWCGYADCGASAEDGIVWEIAFEELVDVPEEPEADVIYAMA